MPSPIANHVAKITAPAEPAKKSPEPKESDSFRDVLQDAQRKPEPGDQPVTPKAKQHGTRRTAKPKASAKDTQENAATAEPLDEGVVAQPAQSPVVAEAVEIPTEAPTVEQVLEMVPESAPEVDGAQEPAEATPVPAVSLPMQENKPAVVPAGAAAEEPQLEAAEALTARLSANPQPAIETESKSMAATPDLETAMAADVDKPFVEAQVQSPTHEHAAPKQAAEPVAAKGQVPEMPPLPDASPDAGAQQDDPQQDTAKKPPQAGATQPDWIREFQPQDKSAATPAPQATDVQPPNPLHIDARPTQVESLKHPAGQPALREIEFTQDNHERIVTAVRTQLLPRGGTMQLRLDPPDLGMLQIAVRMQDGTLSIAFQTSSEETTKLLSHSLAQLKHGLEAQGVSVDRIHVQQAPRDESSDSRDADQQQRHSLQDEASARQEQQRKEMLRRMWRRLALGSDPLDLVA